MSQTLLDVSTTEGLVDAMLHHGVTPAAVRGITPDELEAVYSLAREELEAGQLDEAFEHASLLVSNDPWDRRYHLALALCLQQYGQHDSAARFYAQALAFDATDALATYRIGECLLAMGESVDAREAFEAAITLSWLDVSHEAVRLAAQQRLDDLNGAAH